MPKNNPDSAGQPSGWTDELEIAMGILEMLTATDWLAITELAHAHTSGALSHDAWRTAIQAVLCRCVR